MSRFLIVFPCDTLAYSPTTLNIAEMLADIGDVDMITLWDARNRSAAENLKCRFFYVRIPSLARRILQRFLRLYGWLKALLLLFKLRQHKGHYDLIFAVDSLGYYVTRRIYSENVVYVSLEIYDDIWLALTKKIGVKMLLIQSELRKRFLFGNASVPFKILPNSNRQMPPSKPRAQKGFHLIYMGAIYPVHGVEFCIDALSVLPESFTLTLKGVLSERYRSVLTQKHGVLLASGRLKIDSSYTPQEEVAEYLRAFDAGLCFYDIEGKLRGDFNYISCPSGKMYSYFAAGIPMLGQDVPGLQEVLHYGAGVLIKNLSPDGIAEGFRYLFDDYAQFAEGAMRAGRALCFTSHFKNILAELLGDADRMAVGHE